jgi:hypothetical protein
MARPARREPTMRELDERLTAVERELAQVVGTGTRINEAAVQEFQTFRDAFTEHRNEVRQVFAVVESRFHQVGKRFDASHELIIRQHAEVMAEMGKLQNKS